MARKGILTTNTDGPLETKRAMPAQPRGAVGALQSSLSKLQENAVQELDAAVIHDAGVADRLGFDDEADTSLRESLRIYGQQVPVLVRPRTNEPGQYDIVYGRRRVLALRALGLPVKAMVRQLDDEALVLAQGQENTARQDLSFIEKASFAAQLEELGYERDTIAAALTIDQPMVSRMLKAGRAFDLSFLRHIGSAPGVGRDRWLKLASLLEDERARKRVDNRLPALATVETSDARFDQVFAWAEGKPPPKSARAPSLRPREVFSPQGRRLARVQRTERGLVMTIPNKDSGGFDAWLDAHAEDVLTDLHARWTQQQRED